MEGNLESPTHPHGQSSQVSCPGSQARGRITHTQSVIDATVILGIGCGNTHLQKSPAGLYKPPTPSPKEHLLTSSRVQNTAVISEKSARNLKIHLPRVDVLGSDVHMDIHDIPYIFLLL